MPASRDKIPKRCKGKLQKKRPSQAKHSSGGRVVCLHRLNDQALPDGLAALFGDDAIPKEGFGQIVLFIGLLELFVMKDVTGEGEFPGDFRNGFIDFGWDTFSPKEQVRKRGIELNNGRAAMMGILGLMMHEEIVAAGGNNPIIGLFGAYN